MLNIQVRSHLELPRTADVVIVGGGVVGVVTAYTLARAHYDVLLLERHDIGSGTTSAAAAAALLQTKTSPKKLQIANKSLTLLDLLHEGVECRFEYKHTGSLLAANTPDEMDLIREMNANLDSLGLDVDLLDGAQAREVMPILGDTIIGGSYSVKDAQINPLELVVVCAEQAMALGAKICNFTEVTEIETKGGKIKSVITPAGRVLTDTVINAAGVWAPDISKMVDIHLPIYPLKGELLVTERMPQQMRGTLIAAKYLLSKTKLEQDNGSNAPPERSVGITLVQVEHGNFIIGSTRELAGYDCTSTYGGISELAAQLLELTPSLADVRLLRSYAGLRPLTEDGFPIIDREPTLPGLIHATGFGGDGLAMSAITGEMILSLLNNQEEHEFLQTFSRQRFIHSETQP
jgi:glycine/D-amino acid oxidase-like deaminating enzyme